MTLHGVLHRVCNLPDCLLHFIHTDECVHILQDFVERTVFGHIALDVILFNECGVNATTDERREDILGLGNGLVGETEGLVLGLHPILEVGLQLLVGLGGVACDAILALQLLAAYLIEFNEPWCGQVELILESIGDGRIVGEEIVKAAGES